MINHRLIEETAMNAWPALSQTLYDGWVLRFAKGYTKRANSINLLYPSTLGLDEKIEYCQKVYTDQHLPAIFRLPAPFIPPEFDEKLAERGYKKIDLTHVRSLSLRTWQPSNTGSVLREVSLDSWLVVFNDLSNADLKKQPIHREILDAIIAPRLMITLEVAGQIVCCGLGVLQGELFGLFDIVTHPAHRSQGYATKLVSGMLDWAKEQGALWVFLQVMDNNIPAQNLYAKLGFRDEYSYWYRVPEDWA
jgi:GNAT superfamily N-acetyltransferase